MLRYLGCRPVVKLHSANIAAHISPHPVMGCYFMGGVGHCAALLSVLGSDWASGVRYRSTVPGSGAGDAVGWPSSVQPGSSDKYCAAISGFLGLLQGLFCSISQHTTRGPGSQGRAGCCPTRLGERRKATGATCASPVTANCARNSRHIMIGCNEN